jgi:hypothetical protein
MTVKPLPTAQTLLEHYTAGKDSLLAAASAQFTPGSDPWALHVLDAVYRQAWRAIAERIEPELKAYRQLQSMIHGGEVPEAAIAAFFEPYFAFVLETGAREWVAYAGADVDATRLAEDAAQLIVGDIMRSRDTYATKLSLLGIAAQDWKKPEEPAPEAKPARKRAGKVKAGIHLSTDFLKRSAEELGLKPTNFAKLLKVSPTVIKTAESNGAGALISKDGADSLVEHLKASIRRRQEMLEGTLASLMDYQTAQGA